MRYVFCFCSAMLTACSPEPASAPATAPAPVQQPAITPGLYQLGLQIAPVNGIVVEFQMRLDVTLEGDGSTVLGFDILPLGEDGVPGDSMGRIDGVQVDGDLGFQAELAGMIWPAAYSPIGSDIVLDAVLDGTITGEAAACGTVSGEIVSFGMDMAGSSFALTPWDARTEVPVAVCEGAEDTSLAPIADCPDLTEGRNVDFPSGGERREVELVLPADYDPAQSWPLIFAWHGITADIDTIMEKTDLEAAAERYGVIFAVPQSLTLGGVKAWDPLNGEDANKDLLFFDDLYTCLTQQYAIDLDRVATTGMSNGGMLSGVLLVERSDVIAAAAPMSGGIMLPYADVERVMPTLVLWGGETDSAYGNDFHAMSLDMLDILVDNQHFALSCDHGMGHVLRPEFMDVVVPFLLDHPMDVATLPYQDGLPEGLPAYCTVAQ